MYKATRVYIESLVSALSERTDIKFIEGDRFGTNLKDKIFIYDPIVLQKATIGEVKGILIHEVGHLKYTQYIETPSEYHKKYPCLMDLYNILEDFRIEHLMVRDFRDFASYPISESRYYSSYNNFLTLEKGVPPRITGYVSFCGALMSTLIKRDACPLGNLGGGGKAYPLFSEYHSFADNVAYKLGKHKTPEMKLENTEAYVKKTSSLLKKIDSCKNTSEIVKLVDTEIVPHIIELLEKQNEEDKKSGASYGQHGAEKSEGAMEKSGLKTERSMLDEIFKGSITGEKRDFAELPTEEELSSMYRLHSYALTKHLRSILEDRTASKYSGAYKRGKLLPRNIYKAKTHEPRMYSKRKHFDNPFYEVTFLIDESGSMGGGTRYEDVYQAAFVINKAVTSLKFKTNYVGFDDTPIKKESLDKLRDYRGGGNDENRALKYVEKLLDYDNEQILFILTDGGVSSNCSPTAMLEKFKKLGVHVIPLGIGIDTYQAAEFKQWYPDSILVNGMDDLVKTMADYIKSIIHR